MPEYVYEVDIKRITISKGIAAVRAKSVSQALEKVKQVYADVNYETFKVDYTRRGCRVKTDVVLTEPNPSVAYRKFVKSKVADESYDITLLPSYDTWFEEVRVSELMGFAELYGIRAEDLDDVVHDLKSQDASVINNEGLRGQIEYLLEESNYLQVLATLTQAIADEQPEDGIETEETSG